MPLTLEQYARDYLPKQGIPFPAAPAESPVKARPHLVKLPVRAVLWTCYGTLLNTPGGELVFESPVDFIMEAALDKTVHHFKMWQSMSRKPGKPSEYMGELYRRALTQVKLAGSGTERHPEVQSEKIWEDILKKLQQKDYSYDAAVYGDMPSFLQKLAYFFHASIQGVACYRGAAEAMRGVADLGVRQGLLADGQSFTPAQLSKCLNDAEPGWELTQAVSPQLHFVSALAKARKPSDTLFKCAVTTLAGLGIGPSECLHVGSSIDRDLAPAKRHGFRTALFAGDKNSCQASPEQLKDAKSRPDILLTELVQILDVVH